MYEDEWIYFRGLRNHSPSLRSRIVYCVVNTRRIYLGYLSLVIFFSKYRTASYRDSAASITEINKITILYSITALQPGVDQK